MMRTKVQTSSGPGERGTRSIVAEFRKDSGGRLSLWQVTAIEETASYIILDRILPPSNDAHAKTGMSAVIKSNGLIPTFAVAGRRRT